MVRIPKDKKHELTQEGLRVFVEGPAQMALTSPEAQRLVYNYVKEAGLAGYGMNKFVPADSNASSEDPYPYKGYWLMLSNQWNQKSVNL
jgi:hypothetical protein